jgi:hypothetical protein
MWYYLDDMQALSKSMVAVCFGSDMLWHNKDKHLHDMSQTVGVKRPLNEVDGSAALPITTASILEKTTIDTDPSEVDGSAATPIATTNILEETTTNIDPSEAFQLQPHQY